MPGEANHHLILTERGNESFLVQEVARSHPHATPRVMAPGLISIRAELQAEAPPCWVFSRQLVPHAEPCQAASVSQWTELVVDAVLTRIAEPSRWQMHVIPHYGTGAAGQNRCLLIGQGVRQALARKQRLRLRTFDLEPAGFTAEHSLLQLLLTCPDSGFLSVAPAPLPLAWRRVLWPFPKGEVPVAVDKKAPSRAFAKLLEAEQRLGLRIQEGQRCVDLGAAPGSWSYLALGRGAEVVAVDRAPLRTDLMEHPRLSFRPGDAFAFTPDKPVDWLLCDVIAAPERTIELILRWLRGRWARRFIVTVKFRGTEEYALLERLKHALPGYCDDFHLGHLCANKNEVCVFGRARPGG